MDESLEPPLRLPPEKPVGEITWIAGAEIDECSVVVILPEDFQMAGPEVYIKKVGNAIALILKDNLRSICIWFYQPV
jgi:hypothetical protein